MKDHSKKYTLITGASKGLGKALATQLAKYNLNLILIALPDEGLHTLVYDLKEEGVDVVFKEFDISNTQMLEKFLNQVLKKYAIHGLVNNAGVGGDNYFLNEEMETMENKLKVNVVVPVLITRILLPELLQYKKSFVLNISSMAAFSPIAYKTVYPATKGFIHQFTLGLQEEYKENDILISVVHPGPLKTNEEVSERIKKGDYFTRQLALSPDGAAQMILEKLFRRKKIIYLNAWHVCGFILLHLLPEKLKCFLLSKVAKKELKNKSA